MLPMMVVVPLQISLMWRLVNNMLRQTRSLQESRPTVENRIRRLFSFANFLKHGETKNAAQIAKQFNVSKRTVFRDLETLRAAGVVLDYDGEQDGYQVDESVFPYELLPIPDDLGELLLHASISAFPYTTERRRKVKRAIETLLRLLPDRLQGEKSAMIDALRQIRSIDDGRREEIMESILNAICKGKCLKLEILSDQVANEGLIEFQPEGVSFEGGNFSLVGLLVDNNLTAKVSIDKIMRIEISDRNNKRPTIELNNSWSDADIVIE